MYTYQTRTVLAGAYKARSPKSLLTHVVEMDADGRDLRVLCKRVDWDNISDSLAPDDHDAPATCPACADRDPRTKDCFVIRWSTYGYVTKRQPNHKPYASSPNDPATKRWRSWKSAERFLKLKDHAWAVNCVIETLPTEERP